MTLFVLKSGFKKKRSSALAKLAIITHFSSLSLILTWVGLSGSHAMTVYKTVGDFGEVKYSQFAPESDTKVDIMEVNTYHASPQAKPVKVAQNNSLPITTKATDVTRTTSQNAHIDQKKQHKQLERLRQCNDLRTSLGELQSGQPIYEPNSKGGGRHIDQREIELKKENIELVLTQYCR